MEQQVFTKEFIFERIRDAKATLWTLGLWQGFKNVANVMQYYGSDFEDGDTDETKVEKSINQLVHTIATFPPESVFVIELKASQTANRSGILGPFQFANSDKPTRTDDAPPQTLGNVPAAPPQGYITESMLKGIQESMQHDFDAKLAQYKADIERQQQEREYQRRLDELDQREKEVRDMEKAYNSSVAKAADVLVEVGKRFGTMFLTPGHASAQPSAVPSNATAQLGNAAPMPPHDEKAQAVDDFAAYLYDNYSAADIRKMKQNMIDYASDIMANNGEAAEHGAAS